MPQRTRSRDFLRRWGACSLGLLLFAQQSRLVAQQATPATQPPAAAAAKVQKLNIVVLEGEGAINNVRQRTTRETIVQVEDENRRPVAGAAVTFFFPNQGASAAVNGLRNVTLLTNDQGQAVLRGLQTNNVAGSYNVNVVASYQGVTATTTIAQSNAAVAAAAGAGAGLGISTKVLVAIVAAAGAAVAGGVVAATGGGNGNGRPTTPTNPGTGTPSIVITPGTPSVGGPQ